jgi:hypothetical protein
MSRFVQNMATRNQRIHDLWMDIQDIVGPARLWPFEVRRLFWTQGIAHLQRILVDCFIYSENHEGTIVCLFRVARAIFQLSGDCHHYRSHDLCLALQAFRSTGSFTFHTYCDTGPPFLRSYPKDPWFYLLNAVLWAKRQSLLILNVLGLTRLARAGLELTTSRFLSENTTTRLQQPLHRIVAVPWR